MSPMPPLSPSHAPTGQEVRRSGRQHRRESLGATVCQRQPGNLHQHRHRSVFLRIGSSFSLPWLGLFLGVFFCGLFLGLFFFFPLLARALRQSPVLISSQPTTFHEGRPLVLRTYTNYPWLIFISRLLTSLISAATSVWNLSHLALVMKHDALSGLGSSASDLRARDLKKVQHATSRSNNVYLHRGLFKFLLSLGADGCRDGRCAAQSYAPQGHRFQASRSKSESTRSCCM